MTNLEIVNRALALFGLVGSSAASSMSDTAKNPAAAIAAYTTCRNEVLRMRAWPSVTKRATLLGWHEQATPWTASHFYEIGDRVTNDTAKTYVCTTAGRSAAAGGPTGASTDITDGAAIWDYVEASTAANNWCWIATTAYYVGDVVSNDTGKVYVCITAGTSAGSGGPTGTTADITDNTAHWRYFGTPRPPDLTTYAYAFVKPSDCLKVLKLPLPEATDEREQGQQYRLEGISVYCDEETTTMQYIYLETDPTAWDDLLQSAVVHRIAWEIAFTVTGDEKHKIDAEARYHRVLLPADQEAAGESAEAPEDRPQWIDA